VRGATGRGDAPPRRHPRHGPARPPGYIGGMTDVSPRRRLRALIALLPIAAACGGGGGEDPAPRNGPAHAALPEAHELVVDAPRETVTRDGQYVVSWQPVDGTVPVNEHFRVEVRVARNTEAREPVEGADVAFTCFMPDHGHGMLREPRFEEVGGGLYLGRGVLLHMGGHWTVAVTVVEVGLAATADDAVDL